VDRRIGGETREFGISGLLYKSNVLLYDRQRDPSEESLWSQVEMRAVTGPAAKEGRTMELLPSSVVEWRQWKKNHPSSKVLSTETGYNRNYARDPYASYHSSDRLLFPVEQKRSSDRYEGKDMVVLVRFGDLWKGYPVPEVLRAAGDSGSVTDSVNGEAIRLNVGEGETVTVTYDGKKGGPPVSYMYWFSFSSTYPDAEVYRASQR